MKVNTVSVSINVDSCNARRVDIGMSATFDEDDDFSDGMAKLTAILNGKFADEIMTTVQNAHAPKKILMEKKPNAA